MALLHIFVKPSARSNSCGLDADGKLWIRIAAPPRNNKANEALEYYLAEILGIKKNQVRLHAGFTGRHKQFEIELEPVLLAKKIASLRMI